MSDISEFDELPPSTCQYIILHDDPGNNKIIASCFIAEVPSITSQVQRVFETVLAHEILPFDDNSD